MRESDGTMNAVAKEMTFAAIDRLDSALLHIEHGTQEYWTLKAHRQSLADTLYALIREEQS